MGTVQWRTGEGGEGGGEGGGVRGEEAMTDEEVEPN